MGDVVFGLESGDGGGGVAVHGGVELDDDDLAVFADLDGAERLLCCRGVADCGDDCGVGAGDERGQEAFSDTASGAGDEAGGMLV